MKINLIQLYECLVCKKRYDNLAEAEKCMSIKDEQLFIVGDIVELKYGFGWFDGDVRWVINPDVDMTKHGFGKDCSMGFYYVITYIELDGHRVRYHAMTKAMSGRQGHVGGYTYNNGHYTPKLIDAPEFVKHDSKSLIGKRIDYLF